MAIKITKVPDEGYKYTPKLEEGKDDAFSVWIKPLGTKELMLLEDRMIEKDANGNSYYALNSYSCRCVQKAFVSWENMQDASGKDITPMLNVDGTLSDDSVSCIPTEMITEIASVVSAISKDSSQIQMYFGE